MRVLRSPLGWTLVAVYLVAFLAAYIHAIRNRGVFLYDIWLDLLSIPYILVARLLLQNRAFEGARPRAVGSRPRGDLLRCYSAHARRCLGARESEVDRAEEV